jgi:hypothetical protein
MAKVIFKTFQEAAAYSKNLSMTINATTAVRRECDTWCVDDPRIEQGISQPDPPSQVPESSLYDADGYDSEGYDSEGYDKDGYDRDLYDRQGRPKYPF